ncbi:branched-chain amino acid ABC transporter permease [Agrobacterium rosae]|uniref:Branched-chain amino acid ABC transporter permease n=1 Tax=Agrobacterium rosae TaxID=1972867 RepID=A0AAE5VPV3_9HYPH|nr:branched-chain amino acid ABC transporter permease [Agrobacterium rosae]KAA3514552.1 branched-chain amino acid ABC transporter permease [Agrobacterium rosae]KAA3523215.1 branched-chain amino acid ABC transporter permease [Agrobacterium rosae]MCM2433448.1 branched-chain amino acid ABC transporter permease [Agrobacterium rosae]MDX8330000.1 branched-chain amino acid ABC transporter permease [Agrobacterium rosae]MQB47960.1 branched-chain amino acid ABC transporter permease [Agrobacterium rosae]
MAYFLQQLLNAVPVASLYAALAFGYAIAFAITKRADVTYGAIFAFAGLTCLLFADFGWNQLWLILPATLALGAAAGVFGGLWAGLFIGRGVMRPLASASPNAVTVASIGALIALMESARLAAGTRSLWLPPILSDTIYVWRSADFAVTTTPMQLINSAAFLALVAGGYLVLQKTNAGRYWKAVGEDAFAASLLGVNPGRVFLVSYCAAALFASICGVLATFYYGNMDFGAGLVFGLKVVLISAAGGYTSPLKCAAGAAAIGFAETFWAAYGPVAWRDAEVLTMLVLWLIVMRRERDEP